MKILILQDDFPPKSFGGAGIVAFNLAKALRERGHSVFVITAVQDKKEEGEIDYEGIRVFRISSKYHERWRAYLSLYNPQTVGKIRQLLGRIKPDVVSAHNVHYHLSYHSLKLAKNSGAKVSLTAHDMMLFHYGREFINFQNSPFEIGSYKVSFWQQLKKYKKRYNPFRNIIIRRYLHYVDQVFAVSNALKGALEQNHIGNVEVIHNGIDVSEWKVNNEEVEKFKTKHGLAGRRIILFGGRLGAWKGGEVAIRTLAEVVKKVPNASLLILGKRNFYVDFMSKMAHELGIDKNIFFIGWISGNELKTAYNASNLVCVLSLCLDPFPTVNLEAMASKKPVIGTCFGGTPEVVVDGETGYIVNPYQISEVSEKTAELLLDPAKAAQFGTKGYERIKENFSLERMASRYLYKFAKM